MIVLVRQDSGSALFEVLSYDKGAMRLRHLVTKEVSTREKAEVKQAYRPMELEQWQQTPVAQTPYSLSMMERYHAKLTELCP